MITSFSFPIAKSANSTAAPCRALKLKQQSENLSFGNQDIYTKASKSPVKFGADYAVTNRGWAQIAEVYPARIMNSLDRNDEILDVGAGGGAFVTDLQNYGFANSQGIDKEVESTYVGKWDINDLEEDSFSNQDHIFSTWSLFSYREDKSLQHSSLKKMVAWLKPGGKIYLAPIRDSARLEEIVCGIRDIKKLKTGMNNNYKYAVITKK